jgi:peptidase M28-like protein
MNQMNLMNPLNRLILAALVAVTGCVSSAAPRGPAPVGAPPAPTRTVAAAPAPPSAVDGSVIAEASVRSHMTFLAGDALNGRGSGTRDEWIAAEYLGAQMLEWGIEPLGDNGGFVQQIEVERYETTAPPVMVAGSTKYTHGQNILVQSLSAAKIAGTLQKFAGGSPAPPGSVVLMPETPPQGYQASVSAASAVLLLESPQISSRRTSSRRLPTPAARLIGVPAGAPIRPSVVFLDKAAYAAMAAAPEGTQISIEADVKPALRTQTWNAVGRITGSDPGASSEVILLSAHLDHVGNRPARDGATGADTIYNGADDDASGSVAVLELARALAAGPRPKRTIVFAFFGSEEAGGFGSRFFADRPVVPLSQIVANLQFEMIGRPDNKVPAQTLWLTGYERSTLGPELARQGAKLVQDPHPEENFFTRSDNIQFARRGVIAHTVSSFGLHKEYHQASDEVRHINFAHMTSAIRSMLGPIRWLADSGFTPEWLPGMKP